MAALLTVALIALVAVSAALPAYPYYMRISPVLVKRSAYDLDDGDFYGRVGQGSGSGSLVDYTGAIFGRQRRPQSSLSNADYFLPQEVPVIIME
uniref:Uncharacterized protein n=1 Tax=Plectus sambesii TaxID=2011161 RepID=A0A914VKB3_9BILA